MKKQVLIFVVSLVVFSSTFIVNAQSTATTPTPAPSKTPEPAAIETTEAFILPEDTTLARSFTQPDLTVLAGNVQRPNAIVWLNGKLYVSCSGDWTLYQIDAETGSTLTFLSGIRDTNQILTEETDAGFNLWIPDFDMDTLFLATQRRTAPRRITADKLNGPWGIARLDDDHFLITNLKGNNIVSVTPDGIVEEIATGLRSPAGIVVHEDFVYVSNNGSARRAIEWFEKDQKGESVKLNPLVSGLQNVSSLVMANDGYLYFTYSLGTRGIVGRVKPEECRTSGCGNEQVEIVVYTELPAPLAGLSISPDMELFVHTIYRPEIYKVRLYQ